MRPKSSELEAFNNAMDTILQADPKDVKAAMEAEKQQRKLEAERTGRRGRGRPPKHSSASSPASSEKD